MQKKGLKKGRNAFSSKNHRGWILFFALFLFVIASFVYNISFISAQEPEILYFSASPTSINLGQSSTLAWSSRYTIECEVIGVLWPAPVSGSTTVSPTTTKHLKHSFQHR